MEARMWNQSGWLRYEDVAGTQNDSFLKDTFDKLLTESGFEILNYVEHYFSPQGFTALWLLAESHFAIHSFPEHHKYYWEISSCVETQYKKFSSLVKTGNSSRYLDW